MNVAVITGAANGIGLALTRVSLEKNHFVIMVDNNQDKLEKEALTLLAQYPNQIKTIRCDITNLEQVNSLAQQSMEQFGRVDWLYNNAGIIGPLGPIWEVELSQLNQVMDVNLWGMTRVIQAFCPYLFQQTFRSRIINIASLYALCVSSQTTAYTLSKHAVLALSEGLYFDLKRLGKPVDVSIAFPSFTDTSLLSHPNTMNSELHNGLKSLLSYSHPAFETAKNMVEEVEQKKFYIFPNQEVKDFFEKRSQAILLQNLPPQNKIEKLMSVLAR